MDSTAQYVLLRFVPTIQAMLNIVLAQCSQKLPQLSFVFTETVGILYVVRTPPPLIRC